MNENSSVSAVCGAGLVQDFQHPTPLTSKTALSLSGSRLRRSVMPVLLVSISLFLVEEAFFGLLTAARLERKVRLLERLHALSQTGITSDPTVGPLYRLLAPTIVAPSPFEVFRGCVATVFSEIAAIVALVRPELPSLSDVIHSRTTWKLLLAAAPWFLIFLVPGALNGSFASFIRWARYWFIAAAVAALIAYFVPGPPLLLGLLFFAVSFGILATLLVLISGTNRDLGNGASFRTFLFLVLALFLFVIFAFLLPDPPVLLAVALGLLFVGFFGLLVFDFVAVTRRGVPPAPPIRDIQWFLAWGLLSSTLATFVPGASLFTWLAVLSFGVLFSWCVVEFARLRRARAEFTLSSSEASSPVVATPS